MIQRLLTHIAWPVRLLWIAVALTPTAFRLIPWAIWAIVALATWIQHPISLTVCRSLSPIIALYVLVNSAHNNWSVTTISCAVAAFLALLLMFTAEFGSTHVQAGAYGNEQRFLLRVPVAVFLPLIITWAIATTSILLLDHYIQSKHVIGIVLSLISTSILLWKFAPQMHLLSKRWLVRVPAGWVVHDGLILAENLLVRSHSITSIAPALTGTQALDLSGVTTGIPHEIQLREMADIRLSKLGSRLLKTIDALHVQSFLVATSRTPLN